MAKERSGKKPTSKATPIEALRHRDKRKNIPTEELRDFVGACVGFALASPWLTPAHARGHFPSPLPR
jgi:hypothetical protein